MRPLDEGIPVAIAVDAAKLQQCLGNLPSVQLLWVEATKIWYKWLRRRSQRTRMTWERYNDLLKALPLPRPWGMVKIWT